MNNIFSYDIGKSTMFVFDSSKPIVIRKKGEKKDARIYNPHEYSKEDFLNLNIHGLEDGDDIDVCLAGTFAADRFIVIHNRTKSSTSLHNVKS